MSERAYVGRERPKVGNRIVLAVSLFAALSIGASASADPVLVVTGGSATSSEGLDSFVVLGDGFRFAGFVIVGQPLGQCQPFACAPGDPVSLDATGFPKAEASVGETAVSDGRTYSGVFPTGRFDFRGPTVTVPDVPLEGFIELLAPFTFNGHLTYFDNFARTGDPLFSVGLRGSGSARLSFTNHPELGVSASRVDYLFEEAAPVPEPGTLLLLGTGLLGALRARRGRNAAA